MRQNEKDRIALAKDIEVYLGKGGKIEQLKFYERAKPIGDPMAPMKREHKKKQKK